MIKSSKAVALMLISSIAVLWGFKSCADHYGDDDGYGSTTKPYAHGHSTGYHGGHFFWSGRSAGYRSSGGGSSYHSSGTSRGGFGGSGHAASS
jgi:hypothetical protein